MHYLRNIFVMGFLATGAFAGEPPEATYSHLEFVRCRGTEEGSLVGGHLSLFLTRAEAERLLSAGTPAKGTVTGVNIKAEIPDKVEFLFAPVFSGVPVTAERGTRLEASWKHVRGVHTFRVDLEKNEATYQIRIPTGTTVNETLACARNPLF